MDHSAAWNLFSGLTKNYYRKFYQKPQPESSDLQSVPLDRPSISQEINSSKPTNIANISGVQVPLGLRRPYPSSQRVGDLSFVKNHGAFLRYLRSNFRDSKISLIYLPSSLSIYEFGNCQISLPPRNDG